MRTARILSTRTSSHLPGSLARVLHDSKTCLAIIGNSIRMGFDDPRLAGANALIGQQVTYQYRVTDDMAGVSHDLFFSVIV